MQRPTSPARRDDGSGEAGFTLLEVLCVVAIIALLAAVAGPYLPHGTSRPQLESYAVATAALLKTDRNAALRRRTEVATEINAGARLFRSGATGRIVRVPLDVAVDTLLVAQCNHHSAGSTINFLSSGISCGGVIALSRSGVGYQIRVNWLTGGVQIVSFTPA